MEGYQQGGGGGENGEKIQGISSINGRYKIDTARLRIVWEMEKPKNILSTKQVNDQNRTRVMEMRNKRQGPEGSEEGEKRKEGEEPKEQV